MQRNPYVFVVGCPRSGTTLLQRMLDAHPLLAVSNDPHFIESAPGVRNGREPAVTDELVEWLLGYRAFSRLGLDESVVREAATGAGSFRELVSAIYDAFGRARGKELAGEKTPHYVRFLPLLHALFPGARIIHIIRDGRDVALSTLEWAGPEKGPGRFRLWAECPLAVSALSWRWHVATGLRDGRALGGLYREIRYEDIAENPEPELRALADHLGLPFAHEMLEYHFGRVRSAPGLSAKSAWLPPTPGLRDWRTALDAEELELFEALAGDVLETLGYARTVTAVSNRTQELASRYRTAFEAELHTLGKVPRDANGPLALDRR
jgi:hypothetical protein